MDEANEGLRFALIKSKGDHVHNLGVLRKKQGYLIVARLSDGITSNPEDYLPCAYCKSWLLKSSLKTHRKRCKFINILVDENEFKTDDAKLCIRTLL